jgi:hypothetical protein
LSSGLIAAAALPEEVVKASLAGWLANGGQKRGNEVRASRHRQEILTSKEGNNGDLVMVLVVVGD